MDPVLQVGDWLADAAANELRRGDSTVRLEPKTMDVLMQLARRPGELVTREELLAAAWPGVVVGDEALTQAITKLRRALGDDSRTPAYVETISKRGYRLVAPVMTPAATREAPRRLRAVYWKAAGAAAVLVLAIYVAMSMRGAREDISAGASEEAALAGSTVAVLPFEPLAQGDPAGYLARGLRDGLLSELGRVQGLRVIRAPSEQASGPRVARYLVSGTVQRESERLRVTVYLRDAASGAQLWSERYDRVFGDLFAVQDDMLTHLVRSLPARLGDAERIRAAKRHTQSLEAYDLFLRARQRFLSRTRADNLEARALYRRALDLDPQFARAYSGLAMTYAIEHRAGWAAPASPGIERALELARTAALIDPDMAEIHWALGFVLVQGLRHDEGLDALRRAIELDRSFGDAYALVAGIHTYRGEPSRTIPLMRVAMRHNPEAGYLYYLILGRAYLFTGDTEQALINLTEALRRNPVDVESRLFHAAALSAAGDSPAAQWEVQELRTLEPGLSADSWLQRFPLRSAAHRERLRSLLASAGL